MGLITYPRLNLRCEGTQEGTQGGLHKLLHLSVSDLSFDKWPAVYPNYQNVLLNNVGSAEESVSY